MNNGVDLYWMASKSDPVLDWILWQNLDSCRPIHEPAAVCVFHCILLVQVLFNSLEPTLLFCKNIVCGENEWEMEVGSHLLKSVAKPHLKALNYYKHLDSGVN